MRGIVCGTGEGRERERATRGGSPFTAGRQETRSNTGKNVDGRRSGAGIDRALLEGMLRSVLVIHAAELLGVSRRTVYYWLCPFITRNHLIDGQQLG
jgi:hypothetical protein